MAKQTRLVFTWDDFTRLALLAGAASIDAARPILCSVHLSPNPDTGILEAAATDSYVLAWRTFDNVAVIPDDLDLMIPAKDLKAFVTVAASVIKRRPLGDAGVEVTMTVAPKEGSWAVPGLKWEFAIDPSKYPPWRQLRVTRQDTIDQLQALARRKTQRADLIIAIYDTRWIRTEFKEWRLDQDADWSNSYTSDALYAIASKVTRKAIVEWIAALTTSPPEPSSTATLNIDYLHRISKTVTGSTRLLTIKIESALEPIGLSNPDDSAWGAIQMPTRLP